MRLHIVGLPHTDVSWLWEHCAYTMKIHRLARMMDMQGVPTFLYAGSGTDDETKDRVAEDVPVVHPVDRQDWWGCDTWPLHEVFNEYDRSSRPWTEMNLEAAAEIAARWQHGDVLGIIAGLCQEQIRDELRDRHNIHAPLVEWGIGYPGVVADSFKVFESHAWRHHVAGLQHSDDVRWYDTVIPNAYDEDDFVERAIQTVDSQTGPLVFMARMIPRKGLDVVRAIAETGRYEILTCGQGEERVGGAEHLGLVTGPDKALLLHRAQAVLSPTIYLGPFEGVSVEAMMAGTPAITPNYGCYTETIPSRFRASTLQEFLDAIDSASRVDRYELQLDAWERYGLRLVSIQYADYFQKISNLSLGAGWDTLRT